MRTLIVAPNWIGDAVMAQPLLARIRADDPGGVIDVLAPAHVAPVFEAMAEVSEVLPGPSARSRLELRDRWALAQQVRARGYARSYLLPNTLKSALVPWFAGIGQRIGHHGESRFVVVNERHRPRRADDGHARMPMVEFYAHLAEKPRAPLPDHVPDPVLIRSAEREAQARERHRIDPGSPLIILCPGAEYGPAKRWPARHFAALASRIVQHWPDACVALLGSPKERELAAQIATAGDGSRVRNLCGETSLSEAIALIAQATGVVSNDSGLMHVAAAYRRPQVAVFGSSDPRHTPPRSAAARIEWLGLECSPCFERECPLKHLDCLTRITPDTVFESLRQAIESPTPSPPPQ